MKAILIKFRVMASTMLALIVVIGCSPNPNLTKRPSNDQSEDQSEGQSEEQEVAGPTLIEEDPQETPSEGPPQALEAESRVKSSEGEEIVEKPAAPIKEAANPVVQVEPKVMWGAEADQPEDLISVPMPSLTDKNNSTSRLNRVERAEAQLEPASTAKKSNTELRAPQAAPDPEPIENAKVAEVEVEPTPNEPAPQTSLKPEPKVEAPKPQAKPIAPAVVAPEDPCEKQVRKEKTSLEPKFSARANIVFLIDDSESMKEEIESVVENIHQFIQDVKNASQNNFRILLVFSEASEVMRQKFRGNPFDGVIDGEAIRHINEETWSSWADVAFFRAFAQPGFEPTIATFPEDDSIGNVDRYRYYSTKPQQYQKRESCDQQSLYYRPRSHIRVDREISTCLYPNSVNSAYEYDTYQILDELIPGASVTIVALSDDDINTSASVALDMFKTVLQPLGDIQIVYHSIVGLYKGHDEGIDNMPEARLGSNHIALSKKTGGRTHFIRKRKSYDEILSRIQKDVILAEQSIPLTCKAREGVVPSVTFDGMPVSPEVLEVGSQGSMLHFKPKAFEGFEERIQIAVEVEY